MGKREILKHYKDSLKKWKSVLENILNEKQIDYIEKYDNECGFCRIHSECYFCPLNDINKHGYPYCRSVYLDILTLSDNLEFKEAEKLCKQFIAKIKREIKKVEG